jgi:hypothetical protein
MMRSAFAVANIKPTALRSLNYSPIVEAFRERAKSKMGGWRLAEMVSPDSLVYGDMLKAVDCTREFGVEFLSQSDMFAAEPCGRMIRRDLLKDSNRLLRKWQVLIAGAGTLGESELYGRCVLADGRLEGRYACSDAIVFTFDRPNSSESLYTYAFLGTRVGIRCLRSTSYGTKILRFRPDLLAALPIPRAPEHLVEHIAVLIRSSVENREKYATEMRKARQVIEDVRGYREALGMCHERVARSLIWSGDLSTMGAWNYASTGGALSYLQREWSTRLADVIEPEGLFNGLRFARIPCRAPFGLDLLSQRDVFLMNPVTRRIKHPGFSDNMLFVPEYAILVGSHGQLNEGSLFGKAEAAAVIGHDRAITQDILRVLPVPEHSESLLAFLASRLGLLLLRSTAVGTSVPTMHLGLLRQLPIPSLDTNAATDVKGHIRAAIDARRISSTSELEAVRIIEEEVLPEWLA